VVVSDGRKLKGKSEEEKEEGKRKKDILEKEKVELGVFVLQPWAVFSKKSQAKILGKGREKIKGRGGGKKRRKREKIWAVRRRLLKPDDVVAHDGERRRWGRDKREGKTKGGLDKNG